MRTYLTYGAMVSLAISMIIAEDETFVKDGSGGKFSMLAGSSSATGDCLQC